VEQQTETDRVMEQLTQRQAHIHLLEQSGVQAAEEIEVIDYCSSLTIRFIFSLPFTVQFSSFCICGRGFCVASYVYAIYYHYYCYYYYYYY